MCRAFLPEWRNKNGELIMHGRGNIGVVTLNLPMIYMKSIKDGVNFNKLIKAYLDMVRDIHKKTYDHIGKQKASTNPIMFCEGGLYGGNLNPEDRIESIVKSSFSASFGITALNELNWLAVGKPLKDGNEFAISTINYIQDVINEYKKQDGYLYSIYGTPAESLCGLQVKQFRNKYGVIENVSDGEYFSNSFHLHVSEEVTPFEKQDKEVELFKLHTAGHIQYVRISNPDNLSAIEHIVKRGVGMGLYQGVNIHACTCMDCGFEGNGFDGKCPKCLGASYNEFVRICGYLGFTKKHGDWTINDSKISEVNDRVSM